MKQFKNTLLFITLIFSLVFTGALCAFAENNILEMPITVDSLDEKVFRKEFFHTENFIPEKYSSKDEGYVTSVKDQKNTDLCWCFASLSACESSLIKQGICDGSIDLSEKHLAYFTLKKTSDPLGNCNDDYTESSQVYQFTSGNEFMAMMSLGSWKGAVKEELLPFGNFSMPVPDDVKAYMYDYRLKNGYIISVDDTVQIKNMIMQQGSVATGVYYSPDCYNKETNALFSETSFVNHAISIVGWDDSFSKDNFLVKCRPQNDGAWLVKNSFGIDENDEGYFWLSYEDESLLNFGNVYAFVMTDEIKSQYNYMYDGSVRSATKFVYSGGEISNVFTANGDEKIDYVSFVSHTPGIEYEVDFYLLDKNDVLPDDGVLICDNVATGFTTYAGYYTIPVEKTVALNEGDRFAVTVTLKSETENKIRFYVDQSISYPGGLTYNNAIDKGQSFIKMSTESKFKDTFKDDYTPRVKVFTSDYKEIPVATVKEISAKRNSDGVAEIKWSSCENIQGYILLRSDDNEVWEKIFVTESPDIISFTDETALPLKSYYYKVCCYVSEGNTEKTGEYSAAVSISAGLGQVKSFNVEYRGVFGACLTWENVYKADGYEIYRKLNSKNSKWQKIKITDNPTQKVFIDTSAENGKTYQYRIRAYNSSTGDFIYGTYSESLSVKVTDSNKIITALRNILDYCFGRIRFILK